MTAVIKRRNRPRKPERDYVNGPAMHAALLEWYESGRQEPPHMVVLAISQICDRLATKYEFRNYTYIDEMISEGKLACTIAVLQKKYDPYRFENPFAYFTRIAYNAFVSVIKIEHKETYIKHKELEHYMIDAHIRGENIEEYKMDDSGRIENLINKFEGKKNDKSVTEEDRPESDSGEREKSSLESESN